MEVCNLVPLLLRLYFLSIRYPLHSISNMSHRRHPRLCIRSYKHLSRALKFQEGFIGHLQVEAVQIQMPLAKEVFEILSQKVSILLVLHIMEIYQDPALEGADGKVSQKVEVSRRSD